MNNTSVVLIPVFNRQEDCLKTIRSIVDDTKIPIVDILVVDDGSEIPVILPSEINGFRIKLLRLPENSGIEEALNQGLKLLISESTYEFVFRIDAGDLMVNNRVEKQLAFLRNNQYFDVVGSSMVQKFSDGSQRVVSVPESHEEVKRLMFHRNVMIHPSICVRLSLFRRLGLYSTQFPAAEDYELFMRWLVKGGVRISNIVEPLIEYKVCDSSISVQSARRQIISEHLVKLKYFNLVSWNSYRAFLSKNTIKLLLTRNLILRLRKFTKW